MQFWQVVVFSQWYLVNLCSVRKCSKMLGWIDANLPSVWCTKTMQNNSINQGNQDKNLFTAHSPIKTWKKRLKCCPDPVPSRETEKLEEIAVSGKMSWLFLLLDKMIEVSSIQSLKSAKNKNRQGRRKSKRKKREISLSTHGVLWKELKRSEMVSSKMDGETLAYILQSH